MIKENLDNLIRESMRSKNSARTEVLRAVKTKFMEWETAKDAKPLDEQAVIRKMVSDRKTSADLYTKGSRHDLAIKELAEIDVLNEFKEADVTEDQIKNTVIDAVGRGYKNMGEIMKYVKAQLPNADMKIASSLAKGYL